jgi:hypothetical protein
MRRILPGLVVLLAMSFLSIAGCSGAGKKGDGGKPVAKKEHPHPDKGPHGGALAEWGEDEYHVEYVFDRDKKQATFYILDGHSASKATPIALETVTLTLTHVKPPVEIAAKADPDKDDPKGKSSRFVAVHDALGEKGPFKGEISGKLDKPYSDPFEEKEKKK